MRTVVIGTRNTEEQPDSDARTLFIDHFRTTTGKRYDYDSSAIIIQHDRETDKFSWQVCAYRGDQGEPAIPQYR
jgi:hypothetical protein